MKKHFLVSAGLAFSLFLIQGPVYAQASFQQDTLGKEDDQSKNEEIIIRPKSDKDGKITIEIKDGKTLLNGKPLSTFEDDIFSVEKRTAGDDDMVTAFGGPAISLRGSADRAPYGNIHLQRTFARKKSEANRALLGVTTDKGAEPGAVVKQVSKGSAAEKIGLKEGDIIIRVDEIAINNPDDLVNAIRSYKPEAKAVIVFKRGDKTMKETATLGRLKAEYNYNYQYNLEWPDNQSFNFRSPNIDLVPNPHVYILPSPEPRLGIKAQDTEDGHGVKLLDIDEGSPADKAGLKEGDIITSFNGKSVNSAGELADRARESRGKSSFSIQYTRDGKSNQVEVKIPRKLKTADL